MEEIKLDLTLEEVNIVLNALGKMPFIEVYKTIEKIHLQADKQIKEQKDN